MLREKTDEFSETEIGGKEWEKLLDNIEKTETEIASLETSAENISEKFADMNDEFSQRIRDTLGNFEVSADPTERIKQEIGNTVLKLDLLQKKWQELSTAAPTGKASAQLISVQSQIISTTKKLEKLNEQLNKDDDEKADKDDGTVILTNPKKDIDDSKGKFDKLKSAASSAANAIKKSFGAAFGAVKNIGSKALDGIRSGIGKLTAPVKKFGNDLRRALKSVFMMTGIYAAFRAVKDGLLEAAKADEKFASSLGAVKANLAIAFQPILQTIMPMLNTLMSGLASVTKGIAGFISGIFGKTYQQSADAVKKLQNVGKEAKKAQLSVAGIDEMNILGGGGEPPRVIHVTARTSLKFDSSRFSPRT